MCLGAAASRLSSLCGVFGFSLPWRSVHCRRVFFSEFSYQSVTALASVLASHETSLASLENFFLSHRKCTSVSGACLIEHKVCELFLRHTCLLLCVFCVNVHSVCLFTSRRTVDLFHRFQSLQMIQLDWFEFIIGFLSIFLMARTMSIFKCAFGLCVYVLLQSICLRFSSAFNFWKWSLLFGWRCVFADLLVLHNKA